MSKTNPQVSHKVHSSFLSELTSTTVGKSARRYRKLPFKKMTGVAIKPGFNVASFQREVVLEPSIKIHPEGFAFLFCVGGCSKNLLLFILLHKHDIQTGLYKFNTSVVDEFQNFSLKYFSENYTDSTIKQAHRDLVTSNITLNVKRGTYFLNPLLSGGKNSSGRRNLVNEYTRILVTHRKQFDKDFYPLYKKVSVKATMKPVKKIIDIK